MAKYTCIYCLTEKDESAFNREHVVPRMMGTYNNGFVLGNHQVCEECNSYFSKELENKIGLDSYEAFLRMQYGNKRMSDGRILQNKRIALTGNEGIFKGLKFTVVSDSSKQERVHFDISPCIGISKVGSQDEYDYYSLDNLPQATEETLSHLKEKPHGIISVDLKREDVEQALKDKGYLSDSYTYSEPEIASMYGKTDFSTAIRISIDSIMRRVCAKTVFNYLCFSEGSDYVLQSKFDELRKYIRYGIWSNNLWFRYSQEPVSTAQLPTPTSHCVGYMFFPQNGCWNMCGCLTWFGQLTYIFKLGVTDIPITRFNVLPPTKMAYFDNDTKNISEESAVFVYGGRPDDQYHFKK